MGSEAPCYGGGVSTDYSLHIVIFNTPKSNIFQFFRNLKHPPNFYTLKTFEESSKNSRKIIEPKSFFWLTEISVRPSFQLVAALKKAAHGAQLGLSLSLLLVVVVVVVVEYFLMLYSA